MKKKILIIAAIAAVILLTGTIVGFAVDAANKNAEEQAAKAAAEKELRIQSVLDSLQVSPDSEAGTVLVEVLKKKEMTQRDIAIYSEMSEEIKKMDYNAVTIKLQEYADIEQTLATTPWNEAMQIEGFSERVAQMLVYKQYAEAIAVGEPLYEQNHMRLSDYSIHGKRMAEEQIAIHEKWISDNPDKEHHSALRTIFVQAQFVKISQLAGDMLDIFEQNKAAGKNIDQLNQDMQDLIDYLGNEKRLYNNTNINISHDYSYIVSRYLAGETIKQIIG